MIERFARLLSIYGSWIRLFIAFCGAVLLWFFTRHAFGVSPDSVEYLYAAETFSHHEGLRSIHSSVHQPAWLSHFPPGISVLFGTIAAIAGTSDIVQVSRWVNIVCWFLLLLIAMLLVKRSTQKETAAIFSGLFLLFSLHFLNIFQMAWSEPVFWLLTLLALYAMHLYLETDRKKFLVAAAVIAGIASITRYAGITLILTGLLLVFFRRNTSFRKRFTDAFVFGAMAVIPLVLAVWRNLLLSETATDRQIYFHPMLWKDYREFFETLNGFFLQFIHGSTDLYGGMVLFLLLIFLVVRMRVFRADHSLARVLIIFTLVYLGFLGVSNTFLDFTPLYFRIISPVLLFVFMALLITQGRNAANSNQKLYFFLACLLLAAQGISFADRCGRKPDGYTTSESWMHSETISALKKLPKETLIYSSEPDGIYAVSRMHTNHLRYLLSDRDANKGSHVLVVFFREGRVCDGSDFDHPFQGSLSGIRVLSEKQYPDARVYEIDTR